MLGYLEKAPLQAVKNFPLTNDTYIQAWELLKESYGNSQLIISKHMSELIKLNKVNGSNVTELRELYDRIESNVRALKTVGTQQEHFGSLLILILLEKIPNVIRSQISRQLGKENWNTDEFSQCINREITARESYEFLKNEKGKKEDSFSNSSLHSAGKLSHTRKCLFCYKADHYSDQCQIITDLKARREMLKKNRISFKCLKPGHTKPNCKSSIKCYKCKKEGDHHTALCNPNKVNDNSTEEGITCLVQNNTNILLQAANALVTDKNETQVCPIKLLLDPGSQQTIITQRLVDALKLKPLHEINMEASSSLSKKEGVMKLKEYELDVTNLDSSSGKLIKCLCVPKICPNIKGQSVKQEIKKRDFIKALKLADTSIPPECSIDMLIGSDIY